MTLDTRIFVLDQIGHRDVFTRCAQLLGANEGHTWEDEQDGTWRQGKKHADPGNPWTIQYVPGQGLPAWLMIHYRPGVPLRTAEQAAAHDEWCEQDCDGQYHQQPCWLEVSFDTAYGYQDGLGRGCGDLHASLVADLGRWLDERGVQWRWKNEFTGEIHSGYDRLIELCSGGFEATAWFRTSVLPAIEREAGQ